MQHEKEDGTKVLCLGFVNWFDALKYKPNDSFVFKEVNMQDIHKSIKDAKAILCHMALTDITYKKDIEKIDLIRKITDIPIIIYNHGAAEDKIIGAFEHDITDYFSVVDTLSICRKKLEMHIKRHNKNIFNDGIRLQYKNIALDKTSGQVFINNKEIPSLPTMEFTILEILLENVEKYIPDEVIFLKVWGREPLDEQDLNTLAVHMSRLRKFLNEEGFDRRMIRKVSKKGYILK